MSYPPRAQQPATLTAPLPAGSCGTASAPGSLLDHVAAEFGFAPLLVAAGCSYLRRLAAADPEVHALAAACPDYAPLLAGAHEQAPPRAPAAGGMLSEAPLAEWCEPWLGNNQMESLVEPGC